MDLFALATDREIKKFVRRFSLFTSQCEKLMKLKTLGHDEDIFGFSVSSAWLAYNAGITPEGYAAGQRAHTLAANSGGNLDNLTRPTQGRDH